jgi:hypothetical protein
LEATALGVGTSDLRLLRIGGIEDLNGGGIGPSPAATGTDRSPLAHGLVRPAMA